MIYSLLFAAVILYILWWICTRAPGATISAEVNVHRDSGEETSNPPHGIHAAMAEIDSCLQSGSDLAGGVAMIRVDDWQHLKSQIDALMQEYCAGEMTEQQWEEYQRHQRVTPASLQRSIDAAIQKQHPSPGV